MSTSGSSPPIVYMIAYARSGGTLLNRCLGRLPGVIMLSEVSPLRNRPSDNSPSSIRQQAKAWYGIELTCDDYLEGILELYEHAKQQGKQLVIRDWPVGYFVPDARNDRNPSGRFTGLDTLREHADVIAFGFVRDAIDVWISNGRHRDFFTHYRAYVEMLLRLNIPIYHYESFCQSASSVLQDICQFTGLQFSESFRDFSSFHNVLGDTPASTNSRGVQAKEIFLPLRRHIPHRDIRWVDTFPDVKIISELIGGSSAYHDRPREPVHHKIIAEIMGCLERLNGQAARREQDVAGSKKAPWEKGKASRN